MIPHAPLLWLALSLAAPAYATPGEDTAVVEAAVVEAADPWLTVRVDGAPAAGTRVAVYLREDRPAPEGVGTAVGYRYAGDALVTWSGPEYAEIRLVHPSAASVGAVVRLGPARNGVPSPVRPPPERAAPPVTPEEEGPVALEAGTPSETRPPEVPRTPWNPLEPLQTDLRGEDVGTMNGEARHAIVVSGGLVDDGTRAPPTWSARVAWRYRPAKGLGRIEVGVDGIRGARWVKGADGAQDPDERYGLETAAGYWLWTRLDTAHVGWGLIFGFGAGVDNDGLTGGLLLGLRAGHLDHDRVALTWEERGRLGWQVALDGRVQLADPLRVGLRSRVGALPENDPGFLRARTDGALLLEVRPVPALRVTLAGGLAAYDLLFDDAGPVVDAGVEVRW